MRTAIFYDTETTGFPLWHQPSSDPGQPHLVQLAAALVDLDTFDPEHGTADIIQSIDLIIRPDGWEIPQEASDIHGITTRHATEFGVPEDIALAVFMSLWWKSPLRVAHNESFDARIIRIALKRYDTDEMADQWKGWTADCTMKLCAPICNLPPTPKMVKAGRNHPKSPSLSEAYEHFCGRPLEGAHNAMVDVRACIEVYGHLQALRAQELPPELGLGDAAGP